MNAKFDISPAWERHQIEKSRFFIKFNSFTPLTYKPHAPNLENLFKFANSNQICPL